MALTPGDTEGGEVGLKAVDPEKTDPGLGIEAGDADEGARVVHERSDEGEDKEEEAEDDAVEGRVGHPGDVIGGQGREVGGLGLGLVGGDEGGNGVAFRGSRGRRGGRWVVGGVGAVAAGREDPLQHGLGGGGGGRRRVGSFGTQLIMLQLVHT
ncbi:unnamed protein product [Linum tenue]|uniref:Uncharacterized protein n=1 Tax=Linum tenue TaxID=586396 RepID=A0AAV0PUN5_9ROSI|nr:unnamed protein product [Linum tenue]